VQNNDFASSSVKCDLTLRKRHKLQPFENSVLTEIFAAKSNEASFLFGSYICEAGKVGEWLGHVADMEETKNACTVFPGKCVRICPHGRSRRLKGKAIPVTGRGSI
jgi:hypothetical protein